MNYLHLLLLLKYSQSVAIGSICTHFLPHFSWSTCWYHICNSLLPTQQTFIFSKSIIWNKNNNLSGVFIDLSIFHAFCSVSVVDMYLSGGRGKCRIIIQVYNSMPSCSTETLSSIGWNIFLLSKKIFSGRSWKKRSVKTIYYVVERIWQLQW